jgi:hypothetical protein
MIIESMYIIWIILGLGIWIYALIDDKFKNASIGRNILFTILCGPVATFIGVGICIGKMFIKLFFGQKKDKITILQITSDNPLHSEIMEWLPGYLKDKEDKIKDYNK